MNYEWKLVSVMFQWWALAAPLRQLSQISILAWAVTWPAALDRSEPPDSGMEPASRREKMDIAFIVLYLLCWHGLCMSTESMMML